MVSIDATRLIPLTRQISYYFFMSEHKQKTDTPISRPSRRQLTLPFLDNPRFQEQDFIVDESNEQAKEWLKDEAISLWPDGRLVLWGVHGVGKTHMLSAFAQRQDVGVVSGKDLNLEHVLKLMRHDQQHAFVLDDAQNVSNERDFFHLINMLSERHIPLLMSASFPPSHWCVKLNDLKSRLNSIMSIQIKRPGNALLLQMLTRLMSRKDIVIPSKFLHQIVRKIPANGRDMTQFSELLDNSVWKSGGKVDATILNACLDIFLSRDK